MEQNDKLQSSSIEHSEKQPPQNSDLARQNDKLKLDTHDTLKSSNDPAGLFSKSVTLVPQYNLIDHIPAADTHRPDEDVRNLNNLHKVNNCNNCSHLITGKCYKHGYQMPYKEIECEQWTYRGVKA